MIRLSRHDDTVHREDDGSVRFDDLAEKFTAKFEAKGGGPKKRFQYCLNPNSAEHFSYFRAVQGHSGGTLVDPTLPDDVLQQDDFAELHPPHRERSRHALHLPERIDSGMKKSQKGQAVRVLHSREPDVRQSGSRRSSIRSGQNQNRGVHKYLGSSQKYSILVQSEARSKKRIVVLSNPIAGNRSFQHTTCDMY